MQECIVDLVLDFDSVLPDFMGAPSNLLKLIPQGSVIWPTTFWVYITVIEVPQLTCLELFEGAEDFVGLTNEQSICHHPGSR